MKDAFRLVFGETECELGVAWTGSQVVAWALKVQKDGQLEPIADEGGVLLLRGDTANEILAVLQRRLEKMCGTVRSDC